MCPSSVARPGLARLSGDPINPPRHQISQKETSRTANNDGKQNPKIQKNSREYQNEDHSTQLEGEIKGLLQRSLLNRGPKPAQKAPSNPKATKKQTRSNSKLQRKKFPRSTIPFNVFHPVGQALFLLSRKLCPFLLHFQLIFVSFRLSFQSTK